MPIFQQKLEKGVDETHLTGAPVLSVLIVVAHSSLGNDTNENMENDPEKKCKKTNSRWKWLAFINAKKIHIIPQHSKFV